MNGGVLEQILKVGGPVVTIAAFAMWILARLASQILKESRDTRRIIVEALKENTAAVKTLEMYLRTREDGSHPASPAIPPH